MYQAEYCSSSEHSKSVYDKFGEGALTGSQMDYVISSGDTGQRVAL